jgi:hypothetical protein
MLYGRRTSGVFRLSLLTALLVLLVAAPAASSETSRAGAIRIREVFVPGSPIPTEGEISYVRVRNAFGIVVRRTKLPFGGAWVRIPLGRGTYGVDVWHRTCDANCNYLDPPTDRCRTTVVVRPGSTVSVTVRNRPGTPCRIVRGA